MFDVRRFVIRAVCASLLGCFTLVAAAAKPDRLIEVGGAYTIHSDVLNEQRQYFVHLPPSYWQASSRQRHYPVLYMLDGENFFITASDIVDFMSGGTNGNYAVPEMIVVGVINTHRTRDMTPTHIVHGTGGVGDWSESGHLDAFLSFLEQELIPRVEHDYRTMPYRIIAGHSLAGLAAVDTFRNKPSLFQASIALDPSLWWDESYELKQSQSQPPRTDGNTRLYIGLANTPSIDGPFASASDVHMAAIRAFSSRMGGYAALKPRFRMDYFPGEEHGSVPLLALYNGLAFVFQGYKLTFAEGLNHPESITKHFKQVSSLVGISLPPPEAQLNAMGYLAMDGLKEPDKAIKLFELATTFYPGSSNAYESLGEGHERAGDEVRAREDYRKALELDETNSMARDALARLSKH